jgi:hypothetical protein
MNIKASIPCLIAFLIAPLLAAAPPPRPKNDPPPSVSVPDPNWEPAPGTSGSVTISEALAFPDLPSVAKYCKFKAAGDAIGMKETSDRPEVGKIPRGSAFLVIERRVYRPASEPSRLLSPGDYAEFIAAGRQPAEGFLPNLLEVRFTSGPLKDKARLIFEEDARPTIQQASPPPRATSAKSKAAARAALAEEHANDIFGAARDLDRKGKTAAADVIYRMILRTYPGTSAADSAAERLKSPDR